MASKPAAVVNFARRESSGLSGGPYRAMSRDILV